MAVKKRPKASKTSHKTVWDSAEPLLMVSPDDLIPDESNPNQMDEATFDQLVEEIREQGFDEPILVREHPTMKGKYQIGSGHHRTKAASVLGLPSIPVIVKNWDDRELKVALAKRNALRGSLNREKMVALYRELSKGKDAVQVQREMGFTNQKAFEKMYDEAAKDLPPKQKAQLAKAKESIKSVDDLSSVLNRIFKEAGSELDHGYMVFSWGGKNHHYFQIGDDTEKKLQMILAHCEQEGIVYTDFVQSIVTGIELPAPIKSVRKRKPQKNKEVTSDENT